MCKKAKKLISVMLASALLCLNLPAAVYAEEPENDQFEVSVIVDEEDGAYDLLAEYKTDDSQIYADEWNTQISSGATAYIEITPVSGKEYEYSFFMEKDGEKKQTDAEEPGNLVYVTEQDPGISVYYIEVYDGDELVDSKEITIETVSKEQPKEETAALDLSTEAADMQNTAAADTQNTAAAVDLAATVTNSRGSVTYENRSVELTVNVIRGNGNYRYLFSEYYNGKTTIVQPYSTKNIYSFRTEGIGEHTYYIDIIDGQGKTLRLTEKITVLEEPVVALAATVTNSRGSITYENRTVELGVNVTQGNGNYQYQFREYYNGKTTLLQSYSSKAACSFTTKGLGDHIYYIDIKDGKGMTLSLTEKITVLQAPAVELIATVTNSRGSITYENRTVELGVNVTQGNGDYQYQFSEYYNGKTTVLQSYSSKAAYSFTTKGLGDHTYNIDIKDGRGKTLRLTEKITVLQAPAVELIATVTNSRGSITYENRSVTLSVNVTQGNGNYQYQFSEVYSGKNSGKPVVVRPYSSDASYSFTSKGVGEHTYYVDIKDGRGKTLQLTEKITVVEAPTVELVANVTNSKGSESYENRSVRLTVNVTQGNGIYQYQFSEVYNGETKIVQPYSSNAIYGFNTRGIGVHTYYIDIKDAKGKTLRLSETITVKQEPSVTFTGTVTSSRGDYTYENRNVTLTASITSGSGRYTYQFVEEYQRKLNVIQDYSTKSTYEFTTSGLGEHTYYVNIRNSSNQSIQLVYTITVVRDPTMELNQGIDVSAWQGTIDWKKVADSGVSFAMLRILQNGMSSMTVDSTFYYNAKNASANGIKIGGYKYGYATTVTEAKQEAVAVVSALKASGCKFDYPIAYDMEGEEQAALTKDERTAIIKAFREIIEANGYKFMIYANKNWLETMIDMEQFSDVDVWIAQYRDYTPDLGYQYTGPGNVTIWQYSSKGSVPGIYGDVDMNIGYSNYGS